MHVFVLLCPSFSQHPSQQRTPSLFTISRLSFSYIREKSENAEECSTTPHEKVFLCCRIYWQNICCIHCMLFHGMLFHGMLMATYLYSSDITTSQDNYQVVVLISICCVTMQREEHQITSPGSVLYLSKRLKWGIYFFFLESTRANS